MQRELTWRPTTFTARVTDARRGNGPDRLIRFPSPRPADVAAWDTVYMRWFIARGPDGRPIDDDAPAVLIMHSLHPDLVIGSMVARGLAAQGVHALVLEMPGFGHRSLGGFGHPGLVGVRQSRQALADARRARDVVAALPGVDPRRIGLQGSSLGGFVATATAAMDPRYEAVVLFMTGGDGMDVLTNGQKDAYLLNDALQRAGIHGPQLRRLIEPIEPLGVAHLLDPQRTWLIYGTDDTVIPPRNALLLAEAAELDDEHVIATPYNHYTAWLAMPAMIQLTVDQLTRPLDETAAAPDADPAAAAP
jgi:dienelactone hydrolase